MPNHEFLTGEEILVPYSWFEEFHRFWVSFHDYDFPAKLYSLRMETITELQSIQFSSQNSWLIAWQAVTQECMSMVKYGEFVMTLNQINICKALITQEAW